ncbi:MAG: hypothetical protein HRU19_18910 [Pseudobacteriovorax sp.]|nr:hypothetical protein [Pseudobacteriovorax sp.]
MDDLYSQWQRNDQTDSARTKNMLETHWIFVEKEDHKGMAKLVSVQSKKDHAEKWIQSQTVRTHEEKTNGFSMSVSASYHKDREFDRNYYGSIYRMISTQDAITFYGWDRVRELISLRQDSLH